MNVIDRIAELARIGNDGKVAALIVVAEQLERIADALEKQNTGIDEEKLKEALEKYPVKVDRREFGRLVKQVND